MAISGAFAGLAGGLDMLGYLYHFGVSDIPVSNIGFLGIAVALLGRNTAVGTGLAALLFGALLFGTTHGLQSNVIQPELAGNLTYMIQGLIVLFVGADVLILYVWNSRRQAAAARSDRVNTFVQQRCERPVWTRLRDPKLAGIAGILLGVVACLVAMPPITARSPLYPVLVGIARRHPRALDRPARQAPARLGRVCRRRDRHRARRPRDALEREQPEARLHAPS